MLKLEWKSTHLYSNLLIFFLLYSYGPFHASDIDCTGLYYRIKQYSFLTDGGWYKIRSFKPWYFDESMLSGVLTFNVRCDTEQPITNDRHDFSRILNTNTLFFYRNLWRFIALYLELASCILLTLVYCYCTIFFLFPFTPHSVAEDSRLKPPLSASFFIVLISFLEFTPRYKWRLFPQSLHPNRIRVEYAVLT